MGWLLAAVASAVIGWLVASVLGYVASPERTICEIAEWFRTPACGTKFTVLLLRLHGDSKGLRTRHVRNALLEMNDILDVYRTCRMLSIPESSIQLARSENRARMWLRRRNCDVLLWGEIDEGENVVTLHVIHRDEVLSSGKPIIREYKIAGIGLEDNFEKDVTIQIKSIMISQMKSRTHKIEYHIGEHLKTLYEELRGMQERGLDHLSREQRGSFLLLLGGVITEIGEKSRDPDKILHAICVYREALDVYSREVAPHAWATTQTQLGFAFMVAGVWSI